MGLKNSKTPVVSNRCEDFITAEKLHTCPLGSWCDKCAYCEFSYDDLKQKFDNFSEMDNRAEWNNFLENKVKSSRAKLNSE
jgi:hypothetical protein